MEAGLRQSPVSTLSRDGPELVTMPSRFEEVQQKGTIDVWWIYDDGGEPLSLPKMHSIILIQYILCHHAMYIVYACKMYPIFCECTCT